MKMKFLKSNKYINKLAQDHDPLYINRYGTDAYQQVEALNPGAEATPNPEITWVHTDLAASFAAMRLTVAAIDHAHAKLGHNPV